MVRNFTFCASQRFVEGLTFAGIDVVSLANNHVRDYGNEGIRETERLLADNGIGYTGLGGFLVKEINGVKWAFLGFNGVGLRFDRELIRKKIGEAKRSADVVIVAPHWGREYTAVPEADPAAAPDNPREIARLIVDAGADLIAGNHPHWVQGVEIYNDRFIAYAHGNFIFDQNWSRTTREGVVGKYTFYGPKLIEVMYYPILIEENGQPRFLAGQEGLPILRRMWESSERMASLASKKD